MRYEMKEISHRLILNFDRNVTIKCILEKSPSNVKETKLF